MIGYVNNFDILKVNDDRLLKKYTKIWGRVNSVMNIEFDSEPVSGDNEKYVKPKIKLYRDKVNTRFQGQKNIKRKCIM